MKLSLNPTIAATVVALVTLLVAAALVLGDTEPGVARFGLLVGIIGPTVAALIASRQTDANIAVTQRVDRKVNGELLDAIKEVVADAIALWPDKVDPRDVAPKGRRRPGGRV